jgi:hypothetical protein
MTTMQFLTVVLSWLQADPTHVAVACAIANSLIPTPNPGTPLGKAYKILELCALSFLHAKESGVPAQSPEVLADQIGDALAHRLAQAARPAVPTSKEPS